MPKAATVEEIDRAFSAEGKPKVVRNAFKGGMRYMLRDLARAQREQDKARKQVLE